MHHIIQNNGLIHFFHFPTDAISQKLQLPVLTTVLNVQKSIYNNCRMSFEEKVLIFNVLLNVMHLLLAVLEDNSVNSWKFWVCLFFFRFNFRK